MNYKSTVFIEKKISDILPSKDIKVRILGTVVSKIDNSIFIDDGTGTAQVLLGSDITQDINENQLVRVFGRVIPAGDGFDISAEIIQDMKNLNIKLYTTVMNYYNKLA